MKRQILKRTDHRLDMSPVGRNIFISRDKQAQNRAARRIKVWMRVVLSLVIFGTVSAAVMAVVFYLLPWFRAEVAVGTGTEASSSVSSEEAVLPLEYDEMGLPVYSDEESLFVVNGKNPVGGELVPDLGEVSGVKVDVHAEDALRQMVLDAKEAGLALTFAEGYVSYGEQKLRFERIMKELMDKQGLTTVMAKTEAKSIEPAPGESDFQSGLCIRLEGDAATFEGSKTYSWLKANMGKYGFVFRYPKYKEEYTGVEADPRVIRYVGAKHASAMQQRSMCLEEYLDYLQSQ